MLIAKSSLVDLFFFCRQLVSTQLRGGLGVLVPSAWHDPQTGTSFPLRCPAVVSVQYVLLLLRLIPCLFMWLQWSFSSFVDEIHLACPVSVHTCKINLCTPSRPSQKLMRRRETGNIASIVSQKVSQDYKNTYHSCALFYFRFAFLLDLEKDWVRLTKWIDGRWSYMVVYYLRVYICMW